MKPGALGLISGPPDVTIPEKGQVVIVQRCFIIDGELGLESTLPYMWPMAFENFGTTYFLNSWVSPLMCDKFVFCEYFDNYMTIVMDLGQVGCQPQHFGNEPCLVESGKPLLNKFFFPSEHSCIAELLISILSVFLSSPSGHWNDGVLMIQVQWGIRGLNSGFRGGGVRDAIKSGVVCAISIDLKCLVFLDHWDHSWQDLETVMKCQGLNPGQQESFE